MKRKLYYLAVLFLLVFVGDVNAQAPNWAWAKGIENSGGWSYKSSTVMDANGNLYVTGVFEDSITFDTITLMGLNAYDFFIVKYNSLGHALWATKGGVSDDKYTNGIAIDANGNLYVTGYFENSTATIGATVLVNSGGSSMSDDIFIAKYDSSGNPLWAKSDGSFGINDIPNSISVDAQGNSYITGDIKTGISTFHVFTSRYDSAGNKLWTRYGMGPLYSQSMFVNVNTAGILITGYFHGHSIVFGNDTLTSNYYDDIFIVKYDTSGNFMWAKSYGGNNDDVGYAIASGANGNFYMTGLFLSSSILFGNTTLMNIYNGANSLFIVKFDMSGNALWAKGIYGNSNNWSYDIAVDKDENAYITGSFYSDSLHFGSLYLTNNFPSSVGGDIFVAKYDSSGNPIWAKSAGGDRDDWSYSLDIDSAENLYLTGTFEGPVIAFGSDTLINLNPFNNENIFIAKLGAINTGIEILTSNNSLSLYPNPTTNLLYLSLTKPLPPNTTITITDMQGRVVKEKMLITPGGDAIDVSTLSPGAYLLKLNGQVQRFVKM